MKLVGVTGAICAGKTTVAKFFEKIGAHVIDADKIVHDLYRKDKKIKKDILRGFGKQILTRGRIDRKKLGKVAFNDKKKLAKLCSIVHPMVIKKIKEKVKNSKKSIVVIDAPLLLEAGLGRYVDYVVVVKVGLRKQIVLAAKKNIKKNDLLKRLANQMPLNARLKRAHFVIDNDCRKTQTAKKVRRIWQILKRR